MKIALLGPGEKAAGYTTKRLHEEAKKQFTVTLIPLIQVKLKIDKKLEVLYEKKSLTMYDYFLPRIDSKRAAMGYPVVSFLETLGMRIPYPADTVLVAHNKFLTLQRLLSKGVPVPRTWLTGSKQAAKNILKKEQLPIILKLLSGFGGQGVMIMETKEAAETAIDTMRSLKQEILLEEFIDNPGEDTRAVIAGDEIIATYKRIAAKGEKKANIHAGGRSQQWKLTSEDEELAFKAAEAIRADICAVDMINSRSQTYVMEVNINPGLEGIEKTTNINVAQRIIDFVKTETKR